MTRTLRWLLVAALLLPHVLAAQTAPELNGRVRDVTGAPVAGALIELIEAGARTWSGSAGEFQLRAAEGGRYSVRVSRVGFAPRTFVVHLDAGRSTTLTAELVPHAVRVDSLVVVARGAEQGITLTRAAIVESAASTAAEAIATVPGVVVAASTPGGPQRVSIRGAEARQVLVLLDGAPVNDPVTGEADLSRIRAETIERITVLPGSSSARYGARALGGVVAIETRIPGGAQEISIATGSLGAVAGSALVRGSAPLPWSIGISASRLDGEFDFALPEETGGMRGQRSNADARSADAFAQLQWQGAAGQFRIRSALQDQKRGMPGTAFAPSTHARQRASALRLSGHWDAPNRFANARALFSYTRERVRFLDPQPPAGLPYDDTVALGELYGRISAQNNSLPVTITGSVDGRWYGIDTRTLEPEAANTGSLGTGAEVQWPRVGSSSPWFAQAQLRIEHDRAQQRTFEAHAFSIGFDGFLNVRLSQRSSYAPPTLADQHFRESFGVAPNPDLRAERVPSEVEALVSWKGALAGVSVSARASAWRGNTDDLIVWLPDYRFIWSPRNTDVRRRGGEAALSITRGPLAVDGSWSYAKVTYRELAATDVQVLYRPRHTGSIAGQMNAARWHTRVEARYTGARNTAPTNLNALPGFWSINAGAGARTSIHGFPVNALLSIDRINNEQASLIFGFPQPARVFRFELRASRKVQP